AVWLSERPHWSRAEAASRDGQEISRRTAAFVISREGKYGVKATIAGPLGPADVQAGVHAQYDARPPPVIIAVFAFPFVLMGFVWLKLLLRRRAHRMGTP